jgi:hypothetical protein
VSKQKDRVMSRSEWLAVRNSKRGIPAPRTLHDSPKGSRPYRRTK